MPYSRTYKGKRISFRAGHDRPYAVRLDDGKLKTFALEHEAEMFIETGHQKSLLFPEPIRVIDFDTYDTRPRFTYAHGYDPDEPVRRRSWGGDEKRLLTGPKRAPDSDSVRNHFLLDTPANLKTIERIVALEKEKDTLEKTIDKLRNSLKRFVPPEVE